MIDRVCVCVNVTERYQTWVSVWIAVGILHVLDLCLQRCLCVRMLYGSVHDYIQWQCRSSMLAVIVHLWGWDHSFPPFWMPRNKLLLCICFLLWVANALFSFFCFRIAGGFFIVLPWCFSNNIEFYLWCQECPYYIFICHAGLEYQWLPPMWSSLVKCIWSRPFRVLAQKHRSVSSRQTLHSHPLSLKYSLSHTNVMMARKHILY